MNTVNRIALSFQKRASDKLSELRSFTSVHEEELADRLLNIFESIYTSTSYDHESEMALDYNTTDNEYDACEEKSDTQIEAAECEENNDQKLEFDSFSLLYMQRSLDYYDAINPKLGKCAHTWKSVQHIFKEFPINHTWYVSMNALKKRKLTKKNLIHWKIVFTVVLSGVETFCIQFTT